MDLQDLLNKEGRERLQAALRQWEASPLSVYFRQRLVDKRDQLVRTVFSGQGEDDSLEIGEHRGLGALENMIEEVKQQITESNERRTE